MAGIKDEQVAGAIVGSQEYFENSGATMDDFLQTLFQDALGRPVDAAAQAAFEAELTNRASYTHVADQIFGSTEYRQNLVTGYFTRFLRRSADSAGEDGLVNMLNSGATNENIIALMTTSAEYFGRL